MREDNLMIAGIVAKMYDITELSVLGESLAALMEQMDSETFYRMLEEAGVETMETAETTELTTEARMALRDGRLSLTYDESELSGMEGSSMEISFEPSRPGIVYLTRSGAVRSLFILEQGKRHITTYRTPFMPFEVCVLTREVDNRLTPWGGRMLLDYCLEIKGASVQRIRLEITVRPAA